MFVGDLSLAYSVISSSTQLDESASAVVKFMLLNQIFYFHFNHATTFKGVYDLVLILKIIMFVLRSFLF